MTEQELRQKLEFAERYAIKQERYCHRFRMSIRNILDQAWDSKRPTVDWFRAVAGAVREAAKVLEEYESDVALSLER